jgi:hypothetical protein
MLSGATLALASARYAVGQTADSVAQASSLSAGNPASSRLTPELTEGLSRVTFAQAENPQSGLISETMLAIAPAATPGRV